MVTKPALAPNTTSDIPGPGLSVTSPLFALQLPPMVVFKVTEDPTQTCVAPLITGTGFTVTTCSLKQPVTGNV